MLKYHLRAKTAFLVIQQEEPIYTACFNLQAVKIMCKLHIIVRKLQRVGELIG
jgi:hypothetical protein